jgi:hypothetical protein
MLAAKSSKKLKDLPLLAQLAFAARCARRAINLFRLPPNHPDLAKCCKALGAAIRLAELIAAGDDLDADELAMAEAGTERAVAAASEVQPPNKSAAFAANAAYATLCAVKAAVEAQSSEFPAEHADLVSESVEIARVSASSADDNFERSARLDCDTLHRMSLGRFPDFGEAIDASENGPLGRLFQDFSRGMGSNTKPMTGGADARNKSMPAAWDRSRKPTELGAPPPQSDLAEQISEVDGLREQVEADRSQLQADRAAFDAEKRALHKQLASLTSELEQQRQRHSEQGEQLAAERLALNAEASELNEMCRTIETERRLLLEELAKLDLERPNLQNDQIGIQQQLKASGSHQTDVASRQAELEAREAELDVRCAELEARESQLVARHFDMETRESELGARCNAIDSHEHELFVRRTENEARERELAGHLAQLEARQTQLARQIADFEQSRAQQEELLAASGRELADGQTLDVETKALQERELANIRLQLEVQRNEARAAFESLQEERRKFLEQRLRWNSTSNEA